MGKGINKAVIVGTLGNDPEIKYAENGNAVVNVSVATNESWKDQDGNTQERGGIFHEGPGSRGHGNPVPHTCVHTV